MVDCVTNGSQLLNRQIRQLKLQGARLTPKEASEIFERTFSMQVEEMQRMFDEETVKK